jgi:hypothetical protein
MIPFVTAERMDDQAPVDDLRAFQPAIDVGKSNVGKGIGSPLARMSE